MGDGKDSAASKCFLQQKYFKVKSLFYGNFIYTSVSFLSLIHIGGLIVVNICCQAVGT